MQLFSKNILRVLMLVLVVFSCLCVQSAQSKGALSGEAQTQYGKPKELIADPATIAREFDLDLRAQHDLKSSTVIPPEQLQKIIAGAEKGNKGE
jgi:hypothetical protein